MASGVAYAAMLAAPLVLAALPSGPRLGPGQPSGAGARAGSAVALAVFASRVAEPWNGVVQRAAVTLALAAEVVIAVRMLAWPRRARGLDPRPGRRMLAMR